VHPPYIIAFGHTNFFNLGRARGLLELDLKLDDLLEMQKDNQEDLDLEYVQFNVSKVLALLNRRFSRKKGW
jgi:Ras GTPase-activating-like protein IQGAP2/3